MISRIEARLSPPSNRFRVYAIAARETLAALQASTQVAGLAFLEVEGLIAIVATTEETQVDEVTANQFSAFSENIAELHRVADILPFRFASALPLRELTELMRARREAYSSNLQRIAGCTEINARWAIASEDASDCPVASIYRSGSDYMRAKHRQSTRERTIQTELALLATTVASQNKINCIDTRTSLRSMQDIARLLALADSPVSKMPVEPVSIVGLEILLRREQASPYLQSLRQTHFRGSLPAVVSGPWAPLSFTNDANAAIASAPFHASATAEPVQKCAIFSTAEATS